MVLTTASAVKDALCDFNRLISDKGLSTAYQASYHIVFAREVIGEAEWHSQINAMGIALHSKTDGLPVAKIPPFAEPGRGNSFVPSCRVTFQIVPEKAVTIELNLSKRRVSVKGSRGTILDQLTAFVSFFGPVADVAAQRAPRVGAAAKKCPPAGQFSISDFINRALKK